MPISVLINNAIVLFFILLIVASIIYFVIKRLNAPKRIEELTIFAEALKKKIAQSGETSEKNRYEQRLKKIENKIEDLKLLTTPRKNHSQTEILRFKLKIFRHFLVITVIFALMATFTAMIFYDDLIYYREDVSSLYEENNELHQKNVDLEYKAECLDWYTENTLLVIPDEGALHNTYHKFECEKVYDTKGVQIFMSKEVIDNPKYTKCPYCIEE